MMKKEPKASSPLLSQVNLLSYLVYFMHATVNNTRHCENATNHGTDGSEKMVEWLGSLRHNYLDGAEVVGELGSHMVPCILSHQASATDEHNTVVTQRRVSA
jgi:hypothetical protein